MKNKGMFGTEKVVHGQGGIKRKPESKATLVARRRQKFHRAMELVAYAVTTSITITFERDGSVGFHPADQTPQRFIEEVTILGPYVKQVMQQKNLL